MTREQKERLKRNLIKDQQDLRVASDPRRIELLKDLIRQAKEMLKADRAE